MEIVRKKYSIGLLLFVCALAAISYLPLDIPYKAKTQAVVKPSYEWELIKDEGGVISSVYRNNINGFIESYGNTEFRRGDVVSFHIRSDLKDGDVLMPGDTVGYTYSNEEQMRLIEMKGSLEILEAQLAYHIAGQKPEDIEWAEKELELSLQQLETQRKLMARTEVLMADSVISEQKYDIEYNELKVAEMRVRLAEAKLASVLAGDKPEQISLTRSQIEALRLQINQSEERLSYLTITTPVGGVLSSGRNFAQKDILLRIIDNERYIALAPLKLSDRPYIHEGDEVYLITSDYKRILLGQIIDFNNVVEILHGYQVVYMAIEISHMHPMVMPGNLLHIEVQGKSMNPRQYLRKSFYSAG